MDKCIKVERLCGFVESSFFHSPNPMKGAAARAHYEGVAQMITDQGVVCAIMDTTYDPYTQECTVDTVPELDISALRPEDVMMAAMASLNKRMLEQMQRDEEKCAAKNPNRGRNTRKLTAHGCCEGAAAPNAGMFCPKRQGITAGSPEGGQRGALRKVLWQDKPARGR